MRYDSGTCTTVDTRNPHRRSDLMPTIKPKKKSVVERLGRKPYARRAGSTDPTNVEVVRELQWQEKAFVSAWFRYRDAGKAWKVAYDPRDNMALTEPQLKQRGAKVLAMKSVADAIDARFHRAAQTLDISAQRIVQELWTVATAKPHTMMQLRVNNCRHCHGLNGEYRWVNEAEFLRAHAAWERDMDMLGGAEEAPRRRGRPPKPKPMRPEPTFEGGEGFRFADRVNPECTRCHGQGETLVWLKDSRDYDEYEAALYDGVKMTQHGIEVKIRDRDAALLNIARIMGFLQPDAADANQPGKTFEQRSISNALPRTPAELAQAYRDFIEET